MMKAIGLLFFWIGSLPLLGSTPDFTKHAEIIPISELRKEDNRVSYIKCHNRTRLALPLFPLASSEDATWADPIIPETFILSIPEGRVYSMNGQVLAQDRLVKELLWRWTFLRTQPFDLFQLPKPEYVEGKVAVIAQEGYGNYYHWMVEILPKLALLEESKISYDRLYVPTNLPFMRQTLSLFGISQEKILEIGPETHIEAQELIVPSAPSLSCYTPRWVVDYLRNKLLPKAEQSSSQHTFSKRVFVSRKKASYRRIANEDEVFSLLEPLGFERYNLEDLQVLDQVRLFHQAEVIVAPHGAGLVNLVFARPDVLVFELFQEHQDDSFWYLSQVMGLKHHCIKTTEFKKGGGYTDTTVPLTLISEMIEEL